jgi:tripartite-type tricarboxylate transporter receptor subunit TctC
MKARSFKHRLAAVILCCAGFFCHTAVSRADDFYRGRTINLYVGTAPGGGYDITARLIAAHLGQHLPGTPSFVVRNMPGAGGVTMTNFLSNTAPADGTALGAPQNNVPFEPLFKIMATRGGSVQFDPMKFNWIGNPVVESMVLISSAKSSFKTYKDLLTNEMVVGSTGIQTDNALLPQVLSRTIGAKFKIISGYQGPADLYVAFERGEIQGIGGVGYSGLVSTKRDWIENKIINVLVQFGVKKDGRIESVPLATDLTPNAADREALNLIFSKYMLTRGIFAPAGVPPERVALLRSAFEKMAKSEAFLADAARMGAEIELVTGPEIEGIIRRAYDAAPDVIQRARTLLGSP